MNNPHPPALDQGELVALNTQLAGDRFHAAVMTSSNGAPIGVGQFATADIADRNADWFEQHGYGRSSGSVLVLTDVRRYLVYADRERYTDTIHNHRTAEQVRNARPVLPYDRDPGPDDLAEGLAVDRETEPGRADELITATPCCGRTIRIAVNATHAACCGCTTLYAVERVEESDGGILARFTVIAPAESVAVASHRAPSGRRRR